MKLYLQAGLYLFALLHCTVCQDLISPTHSTSSTPLPTVTPSGTVTPVPQPTPTPTTQPTLPPNACDSQPCQNEATCVSVGIGKNYICQCADGWKGRICNRRSKNYFVTSQIFRVRAGSLIVRPNAPQVIRDQLTDPSSSLFKDSCSSMRKVIIKSLTADGRITKQKIICRRFFFASLHFDFVLELETNVTTATIKDSIITGYKIIENSTNDGVLLPETIVASDYDECNTSFGYCASTATCVNLIGGYRCECNLEGYELIANGSCSRIVTPDSDEEDIIIIVSIVCGGLFLLVILLIILLVIRKRRTDTNFNSNSSSSDFGATIQFRGARRIHYGVHS